MRQGNRGATGLRVKRRGGDPMQRYDALPPQLRNWMANAVLPWSPTSCLTIWRRANGPEDALHRLHRAEQARLAVLGKG